jgi:pyruvate kinase
VRSVAGDVPVIAKIERAEAYANLADILSEADGAMVARGDLGVEMGIEPLPRVQKEIIARTHEEGGISITATEMLESMTNAPRPTRAEVTDVANAVLDGSDAVMLSAETAVGKYPVRVIEVMAGICTEAERTPGYPARVAHVFLADDIPFPTAIAQAAADTANLLGLGTVVAFTESGNTARLVSRYRPNSRIVAFTPSESNYRRLAAVWGVTPLLFPRYASTDEMIAHAEELLLQRDLVSPGEWVAMIAGIPPNQQSSTNLLKLHVVGG